MHGHGLGSHSAHGPERSGQCAVQETAEKAPSASDIETQVKDGSTFNGEGNNAFSFDEDVLAQIVGVGILEFGVLLHRSAKFILCSTMI